MSLRTRHRKYGRLNEGEFRSQVQDDRKGNRIIRMWCWSLDCIRPTCRAKSAFNLRLGHVEWLYRCDSSRIASDRLSLKIVALGRILRMIEILSWGINDLRWAKLAALANGMASWKRFTCSKLWVLFLNCAQQRCKKVSIHHAVFQEFLWKIKHFPFCCSHQS